MPGQTLFDKIWDRHVIADLGDGYALLHISRHLMHDGGGRGLQAIKDAGYRVRNPDLTFATFDHVISTEPGRTHETLKPYAQRLYHMRDEAKRWGIKLFDLGQPGQGIVHVMGPEQGVSLPGTLLVCGDSHTCTHGGMGAIAFGVGATEVIHVLATQSLVQPKPKRMRVTFDGKRAAGVTPKDMILHLIGQIGAAGGTGYAVEYAGSAIRDMEVEGRLTVCNLSIELGAKIGMVAPDDKTFEFLKGRPYAPKGAQWDEALADWRSLASDADAAFDVEVKVDVNKIVPQITWGTSPEHVIPVTDRIPDPASANDPDKQKAMQAALDYMGLDGRHADPGDQGRLGVHRLVHQQPDVGSARCCPDRQGPQGGRPCARLGRARLGEHQAHGGSRGTRPRLPRRRLRMARTGLLDVPGRQRRHDRAGREERLDLQPQLRRPPGTGRSHPPGESRDGRGRRHRRPHRRCSCT